MDTPSSSCLRPSRGRDLEVRVDTGLNGGQGGRVNWSFSGKIRAGIREMEDSGRGKTRPSTKQLLKHIRDTRCHSH